MRGYLCVFKRALTSVVVVYTKFGNGLLNEVSERWPQRAPRTVRYNRIDLYSDKTINFHKFKYFQFIIYILLSFYIYTHTHMCVCVRTKRAIWTKWTVLRRAMHARIPFCVVSTARQRRKRTFWTMNIWSADGAHQIVIYLCSYAGVYMLLYYKDHDVYVCVCVLCMFNTGL